MEQVLYSLISGALAGGIVGQLTAIFLTNSLVKKREVENWLRNERHKVFCELLDVTSAVVTREEKGDYDTWPDEIRVLSQKVHLLHPGGHAPSEVADTLEKLFQLVLRRKLNQVSDDKMWRHKVRDEARKLREGLSEVLLAF